ncbi:unnamed protein product, partial [Dicrocoelium dendriticum]
QLLEGIQTPSVKREFRLRRPTCLQSALKVADQLEQVDESMGPLETCCVLNRHRPARLQPPDRRNWNRVPFRGDYSRPPVQSYFRRPRRPIPNRGLPRYNNGRPGEWHRLHSHSIPTIVCASTTDSALAIELQIAGVPLIGLIDTGACKSLIRSSLTNQLAEHVYAPCRCRLTAANG